MSPYWEWHTAGCCTSVWISIQKGTNTVKKYKFAALAGTLAIYALPLYYRFAEDGATIIYTYGSSVMATYIFAVGFLIINFFLMRKEKSKINPARGEAVQIWMVIWIGSSLIQFFAKNLLIVGYMSAIGMMLLYLKLENPETNLDRESGLFNHNALMQYIRQLFGKEQKFAVLTLMLKNPLRERIHSDLYFLSNISDAFVFKNMEDEILLVFEKPDAAENAVHGISQNFRPELGNMIYMPDSDVINYEQLAEEYIHIMEKYEVPAEQINLEITESASLNAKTVLLNNMQKLIARGVRFSLDDFGTGQSNLNYIVDMPVDIVKFDRDMTTAYFESPKAKYVMDNAINMIHGMNLEIVSEGIETKEQYQTMKELGISYIQGYYFSKPLAEEEFWNFICRQDQRP